jgi:hypothetical protein
MSNDRKFVGGRKMKMERVGDTSTVSTAATTVTVLLSESVTTTVIAVIIFRRSFIRREVNQWATVGQWVESVALIIFVVS